MAMSLSQFKDLLEKCNVRYFLHPTEPIVIAGYGGTQGRYQMSISLQLDGNFLQFRTTNYAFCRADHPHVGALKSLLIELNIRSRWVKWVWIAETGEVTVIGDCWIMDGTITVEQFNRMLNNLLSVIDMDFHRIKAIIDTGNDPGEVDPGQLLSQTPTSGSGPPTPTTPATPVTEI